MPPTIFFLISVAKLQQYSASLFTRRSPYDGWEYSSENSPDLLGMAGVDYVGRYVLPDYNLNQYNYDLTNIKGHDRMAYDNSNAYSEQFLGVGNSNENHYSFGNGMSYNSSTTPNGRYVSAYYPSSNLSVGEFVYSTGGGLQYNDYANQIYFYDSKSAGQEQRVYVNYSSNQRLEVGSSYSEYRYSLRDANTASAPYVDNYVNSGAWRLSMDNVSMLIVDRATKNVGIKQATPTSTLHVGGAVGLPSRRVNTAGGYAVTQSDFSLHLVPGFTGAITYGAGVAVKDRVLIITNHTNVAVTVPAYRTGSATTQNTIPSAQRRILMYDGVEWYIAGN